jgi:phosphohistidine phosphatase SixA
MTAHPFSASSLILAIIAPLLCLILSSGANAEMLSDKALVSALREGGYVLVMRHASSPLIKPDKATADPGNPDRERQLDQSGKDAAQAMGKAIHALHIPIGNVISSPAFRAVQTVRLAGLGEPMTFKELAEGAKGMQSKVGPKAVTFLRHRAEERPAKGTDTLVVTHTPNIKATFGPEAAGIISGEALVFHPDGKGGTTLVGRVKIADWPGLAETN